MKAVQVLNEPLNLAGGENIGREMLCPVHGEPKRPPGKPTHQNAKVRFIVYTYSSQQGPQHKFSVAVKGVPHPSREHSLKGKKKIPEKLH